MSISHRIRHHDVRLLSDNWYTLKVTIFDWLRSDGEWQTMSRETYDRGNGATLLPYNRSTRRILLVRQFRYPAYVNGHDDLLLETPAGLLDDHDPETRIRLEVEEETGYQLGAIEKIFDCFMSPGSVTERLHFFVGEYDASMKRSAGGGIKSEGEDISVVELPIEEAIDMVRDGRIRDAKTIMLLQHAVLNLL